MVDKKKIGELKEEKKEEKRHPVKRAAQVIGPGFITGGADDDPTGIATYAQAGAKTEYALLWTTLLTFPMLILTQYVSSKVAVVHKNGLTEVLSAHYPRSVVCGCVLGLLVANTVNVGADIGAFAAAINMFVPALSIKILVFPLAIIIVTLLVMGSFRALKRVFELATLALIAYIVSAFLAGPDWRALAHGMLIPHLRFDKEHLSLFVAMLGGNISPYLFFWQAELEGKGNERPEKHGRLRQMVARIREAALDTTVGMFFSNLILLFIGIATAATLYKAGHREVTSAAEAAEALRPLLGVGAEALWAIGIVASAMVSVPALAGSIANAIASLFRMPKGFDYRWPEAKGFYTALAGIIFAGVFVNFLSFNPIQLLVVAAVVNGFLAPPLLVLMLRIGNNPEIMGTQVNSPLVRAAGWATVSVMTAAALGLAATLLM